MLRKTLLAFLNPLKLYRAWRTQRKAGKYDRSKSDLELEFYSRILRNDFLHLGYFAEIPSDVSTISIADFENVQQAYCNLILDRLGPAPKSILDAGCGMGGIAKQISSLGHEAVALTPNSGQIRHIRKKYPEITCYESKFETFEADQKFDVILHAESFQYIKLREGISKVNFLLKKNGTWIVCDFFRTKPSGKNNAGHL